MSLKHPNAVQETTTVTGTGDAVLLGAALGRLPFNASVNNGDTVRIQIEGVDVAGNLTGEFEISLATYNGGPNSLTRSVVETSSNSNNLVVFSAGTKRVYACSPTNNDLTTLSTPAASALTGTTLAANVVTSSLTTIGTLVAGSIPYSLITGAPAAVNGANPTASVGLAAVNGSAATFLRSDGAPPLSQAIVPTWTGLHTFQAQTSAQAAVFRSAQTTPTNTVSFSLFDGTVKSFVDANGLFTIGSANTGVASLDVSSAATTFPGNYSASCVLRGVFPALWLRGSDAAGIMFGYFGTKAMGIASTTVGGALDAYRMFFDTNGLVSINNSTTTPLAQLHVVASASTTGLLVQASTSGKSAVFKAAATTPGNITEWQASDGTVLVSVDGRPSSGLRPPFSNTLGGDLLLISGNSVYLDNGCSTFVKNSSGAYNRMFFVDSGDNYGARNEGASGAAFYGCSNAANSSGQVVFTVAGSIAMLISSVGNIGLGATISPGAGVGVVFLANAGTNPSTNPAGGGVIYTDSGALKYRGSGGTVTTIAPA